MSAESEVKIHVGVTADEDALESMRAKLKELRKEQREFETQGAPKAAEQVRRKADRLERTIDREGARRLRVEDDDARRAKQAPLEEQKQTIARGMVEEAEARAAGNTAAADAMHRELEIMQRALTLQRSLGLSQKDALTIARQERAETEALAKAGVVPAAGVMGRVLASGALGMVASEVVSTVMGQMAFGEMMSNTATSTRAGNDRQRAILSGWRGSAGQLMQSSWAAEDRAQQLERERPQLQSDQKFGAASAALEGAAWGGGIGAMVGSVVPVVGTAVGAAAGAAIGAAIRGIPAYIQGGNKVEQSEQEQQLAEEQAAKDREAAQTRYREVEGGLELSRLRNRSKRTMEGSMGAFSDEMAAKSLEIYKNAMQQGATEPMAREMATLTYQNDLRDRQVSAGAGLVDARTGGAGIAAAAQWAQSVTPLEGQIAGKIDVLIGSVNAGNQTMEREKLHK